MGFLFASCDLSPKLLQQANINLCHSEADRQRHLTSVENLVDENERLKRELADRYDCNISFYTPVSLALSTIPPITRTFIHSTFDIFIIVIIMTCAHKIIVPVDVSKHVSSRSL